MSVRTAAWPRRDAIGPPEILFGPITAVADTAHVHLARVHATPAHAMRVRTTRVPLNDPAQNGALQ